MAAYNRLHGTHCSPARAAAHHDPARRVGLGRRGDLRLVRGARHRRARARRPRPRDARARRCTGAPRSPRPSTRATCRVEVIEAKRERLALLGRRTGADQAPAGDEEAGRLGGGDRGRPRGRGRVVRAAAQRRACCRSPPTVRRIAVVGPNGDREVIQGGGSARVTPTDVATIADGLRERLGDGVVVEPGSTASRGTPALAGRRPPARRRHRRRRRRDPRRRRRGARHACGPATSGCCSSTTPATAPADGWSARGVGHRSRRARRARTASRSRRTARRRSPSTARRWPTRSSSTAGTPGAARARGPPRRPAAAPGRRAAVRAARAGRRLRAGGGRGRGRPTSPSSSSGSTATGRPRAATATSLDLPGPPGRAGRGGGRRPAAHGRGRAGRLAGRPVVGRDRCPALLWGWLPGPGGRPGHRRRALRRRRARRPAAVHDARPGSRTRPSFLDTPSPACSATRRACSPATAGTTPAASSRRSRSASGSATRPGRSARPVGVADRSARASVAEVRVARHQHRRPRRGRGRAALRRRSRARRCAAPAAGAARLREGARSTPASRRELTFALGMRDLACWDRADRARGWPRPGSTSCGPARSSRDAGRAGHRRAHRALDGARLGSGPSRVASTAVHPIERLRYVARASGADQALLVRETAQALSAFRGDPSGLVAACRRIVDRHPTSAPLWWLCARVLTSPDGQREAWDAVDEIEGDRTAAELAFALPEDATVCVIGWPELVGEALPPRGDVEVLAVDSLGEGSGLVRRLVQAGIDAVDVPTSGLGAAVCSSDVLLLEAVAVGPDRVRGGERLAGRRHRRPPRRGARVADGRRRPAAARPGCGTRWPAAGPPAPPTRGTSTRRSCRSTLVDQVCGPRGLERAGRRAAAHRLPGRPRAVRRRERARHLPAVDTRPMSRRDQIKMTDAEVDAFLAGRHTMNVAVVQPRRHDPPRGHVVRRARRRPGVLDLRQEPEDPQPAARPAHHRCSSRPARSTPSCMGVELVGRAEVITDHDAIMRDRRGRRTSATSARSTTRSARSSHATGAKRVRRAHQRRPGRQLGPPQARRAATDGRDRSSSHRNGGTAQRLPRHARRRAPGSRWS